MRSAPCFLGALKWLAFWLTCTGRNAIPPGIYVNTLLIHECPGRLTFSDISGLLAIVEATYRVIK
jgi:hypothetical protein